MSEFVEKKAFMDLYEKYEHQQAIIAVLRSGLESIAKNTCCDKCQEAALVAKKALAQASGERRRRPRMSETMYEKEMKSRITKGGKVYKKETGRLMGYDTGGGWVSGPWECVKGHIVEDGGPVCRRCMEAPGEK